MLATVKSKNGIDQISMPDEENEFYKTLSERLTKLDNPNSVLVETCVGSVQYTLSKRSGTLFIQEGKNNLCFTDKGKENKTVYLTCIDKDKNNYKYYKLTPLNNGMVRASYGRIGSVKGELFGERSYDYPERMFWIKYQEKISKGYEDKTEFYVTEEDAVTDTKLVSVKIDSVGQRLYDQLKSWARRTVESHLGKVKITQAMVDESKRLLKELYKTSTVDEFNRVLLMLLAVSPRKVWKVEDLLAEDTKDFQKIIQREEDLVCAMEALVPDSHANGHESEQEDDFASRGIEIKEATQKQKDNVLSMLDYNLKHKVRNVYRIKYPKQEKKFLKYLDENNLTRKDIKGFWHGSRNENWLSIIENSLQLHPNAIITGKMYGEGIYFAPSSTKSWGYTSVGKWTGGSANAVFMGLFATAYGDPLYATCARSYSQDTLGKHNCVYAKKGTAGLYNDEVVFYDESAMLLEYLVEFTA